MAVDHPHFGTFCEICFRQLTPETCAVDSDGVKWDVCAGGCALQAGIREATISDEEFAAFNEAVRNARGPDVRVRSHASLGAHGCDNRCADLT